MKDTRMKRLLLLFVLVMTVPMGSCATTYYKTMEVFGKEKRDILASRVKDAREDQTKAKEQFESALDRFSKLVDADSADLRRAYDKAKADYDKSESRANAVHDRVKSVETVGRDLFKEWEQEIGQYTSAELKSNSRRQLKDTQAKFDQMLGAMKRAEASMTPVLNSFRDSVLYLKHNLNAQAVASMKGTVADLERDVRSLIQDMERSIAESDRFVKDLASAGG